MKHDSKLQQQEQEQEQQPAALHQQEAPQVSPREFASVEEMLRADAAQTLVPPAIAERLNQSSKQIPQRPRSWWRRLFD